MSRTLTEQKVLHKLGIEDFRHITKDKVLVMATMLDKIDPEVAKKAIEQFPEFSKTMKEILTEYKAVLDAALKNNADSVQSFYATCDAIIQSLEKELDRDNLSFQERRDIIDKMIMVAQMKGEKDTDNKNFLVVMSRIGLAALGLTTGALLIALGGNIKLNFNDLKKIH